ncbi:hypothetical protein [Rhizobium sp. CSW-27]|uniref:hypothetical protein n=1 Tax=Rhizobium sp. CSW-27 TaxID=2839985 RepID=UPI001C017F82|nr:hypothetical protein [Rhizobium sp. CSW-27]MBT9371786.1 hypothetical protein [Rhizobium sp. CSW-27]
MQKLNMIQAFAELPEGTDATFQHPQGQAEQARLIKMRVNAPQAVNLYITPVQIDEETGEVTSHDEAGSIFLAHVAAGFDQIEFFYRGSFCLAALGGSIWLDTSDNTAFSVEASDYSSYARLWEREERDPRILEIERAARHNQEMLLRQMAEDRAAFAAQMAQLAEKVTPNVSASSASGNLGTAGAGPQGSTGDGAGDPAIDAAASGGDEGEPNADA